jgi:hypothetical protein
MVNMSAAKEHTLYVLDGQSGRIFRALDLVMTGLIGFLSDTAEQE